MQSNRWTPLKCEGCGNPLAPLASVSGLIHLHSAEAVQALAEAVKEAEMKEGRYSHLPIIGGDFHVEVIRSPLADLLRCTNCGMLYERETDE